MISFSHIFSAHVCSCLLMSAHPLCLCGFTTLLLYCGDVCIGMSDGGVSGVYPCMWSTDPHIGDIALRHPPCLLLPVPLSPVPSSSLLLTPFVHRMPTLTYSPITHKVPLFDYVLPEYVEYGKVKLLLGKTLSALLCVWIAVGVPRRQAASVLLRGNTSYPCATLPHCRLVYVRTISCGTPIALEPGTSHLCRRRFPRNNSTLIPPLSPLLPPHPTPLPCLTLLL